MSVLLDTNVLVRMAHVVSPAHQSAVDAVTRLVTAGIELHLVPQVIYEFWSVSTRPVEVNGLGMSTDAAERSLQALMGRFRLLRDERGVFQLWRALVVDHDVKGKNAHDARLVAAMQRHGLTRLLTFNKPDFARFPTIQVFTPDDVLAGRLTS